MRDGSRRFSPQFSFRLPGVFLRSFYAGLLTALFLLVPIAASNAQDSPASGGIGLRLMDIPEATQNDPRAQSYIVDSLPPGTTIERRVAVQNSTGEPQSIEVYASAAEVKENSFTGLSRGEHNELSGWITTDTPVVELAAGESAEVTVRIAVPADAPEGEQYAAIWAEVRSAAAPGTQVINASRIGIRVYLAVGTGNGPPAAFTIGALHPGRSGDGAPQVTASVTNTGGRAVDVQGGLALTEGPGGLSVGSVSVDGAVTIRPGETAPVSVTLAPELPAGPWHARLDLKSGLVTAQAEADLTFGDAAAAAEPDGDYRTVLIAAAVLALLLGCAAAWLVRRRRNSRNAKHN